MIRPLLVASVLVLVTAACERKHVPKPPPGKTTQNTGPAEKPPYKAPPAPAEVPPSLKARIEREWPGILEAGTAFMQKFSEAGALRKSGDRDKLDEVIKEANKHFTRANDAWAGIYNDVEDMPEKQAKVCRRYISRWNRKVDKWVSAAKGLAQYSRR